MLKLHEGVKFISILLCVQQEKFYALPEEMKHRIGVMIIDAGIVICSLSVNEMKDSLAKETELALVHLLKELQFVMEEVAQVYPLKSSQLSFPRTNELGSIDFLLENLKELAISKAGSGAFPMDQIQTVQEELLFLRSFLENIVEKRNQNERLQAFWSRAMEVAYKAEVIIDSTLAGDKLETCLDVIAGDIDFVKTELAEEIYDGQTHSVTNTFVPMPSQVSAPVFYEHPVGLEDELETIIDRLMRGTMQLDIVPVVGMPGLGKTTLANSVYCHRSVDSHFHIRAWCCVSRVYSKKSLLLQILHNPAFEIFYQSLEINEDDLAENLYKLLKGKRYLIILDDVWDIKAWKLLERSLPDDSNGSRILLTSRSHDLLLDFTLFGKPHHLRPLSDEESWALLQKKIFGKEVCPPGLGEVGFRIAKSCKGLPLAVVLIAGILANTKLHCTIWEKFAESLISSIAKTEECMNTLEQSYRQLPEYLKPCLLYFGAFQEDQDIPVRRLLWLWISEGFVQKTEEKSLEDMAEDYLMDLIGRSLVMVTKQRSIGGAKTCRLHDLVREFCLEKAKEESFLQILNGGNDLSTFTGPCPHRLCIYLTKAEELERSRMLFPRLRCLLFFLHCAHWNSVKDRDGSLWFLRFKLLRVLDIQDIHLVGNFPMELILLVHLRYLAINSQMKSIPSAIDNLSRLETFLVKFHFRFIADVVLPNTIWNIKTLRHLQITGSLQLGFSLPIGDIDVSENLYHLDTFCCALDCSDERLQKILKKLPSIRRLKCVGLKYPGYVLKLDSLSRLESLKLHYFFRRKFELPINLKKLILSYNHQPWSEISTIGKLSNLEVLKLGCNSFVGEKWEMQEGEFPNLRFLKLSRLDIRSWTAVPDNFSRLEKLVLHGCVELQEVPSCLEESSTIKTIEVQFGRKSLISSVKQIQQEQMDLGYSDLKIVIGATYHHKV